MASLFAAAKRPRSRQPRPGSDTLIIPAANELRARRSACGESGADGHKKTRASWRPCVGGKHPAPADPAAQKNGPRKARPKFREETPNRRSPRYIGGVGRGRKPAAEHGRIAANAGAARGWQNGGNGRIEDRFRPARGDRRSGTVRRGFALRRCWPDLPPRVRSSTGSRCRSPAAGAASRRSKSWRGATTKCSRRWRRSAELRVWAAARGPEVERHIAARLQALSAPRPDWAGLKLARPLVMGIVNVTPDSFSDGGRFLAADDAVAHGRALLAAGADILDIGGESTRPGAAPVAPAEEIRRIEPVVRALAATGAPISVDTRHAATMAMALAAGARIVNDVSALADPDSSAIVARARRKRRPHAHAGRAGDDAARAPLPLRAARRARRARGADCGVRGGGNSARRASSSIQASASARREAHNLQILRRLALFQGLGTGVMVGLSRKSFLARLAGTRRTRRRAACRLDRRRARRR